MKLNPLKWFIGKKINKEPQTIQDALQETAELAMDRGDLLTRGDLLMAVITINNLEKRLKTIENDTIDRCIKEIEVWAPYADLLRKLKK